MRRIDAVRALAALTTPSDLFVSSIGAIVDDWWNLRPEGADNTFFTGILGSVSSTALGLAIALPHRRVVALETDGSVLMNTGILCTLGNERPKNLSVLVFDNEVYENIGGPPTLTAGHTDLGSMAAGAGCPLVRTTADLDELRACLRDYLSDGKLGVIVAKIEAVKHPWSPQQRKPTDGVEDKYRFIRYVEQLEGITIHPGAARN